MKIINIFRIFLLRRELKKTESLEQIRCVEDIYDILYQVVPSDKEYLIPEYIKRWMTKRKKIRSKLIGLLKNA